MIGTVEPGDKHAISVAVIGGGVFGIAASLELALTGAKVTVYERREDLLIGASGRNLFRLHRGYHYPRDLATAKEARDGYDSFKVSFGAALAGKVPHHYAIALNGSKTTAAEFRYHCERLGLRADPVDIASLRSASIDSCFEVDEDYFDLGALRRVAWSQLAVAGVQVHLRSALHAQDIAQAHDFVVVATYDSMNEVLAELGCATKHLQYELCEVPVVSCSGLSRLSVVVMDGAFISVAPYEGDLHLLYDVEHSVHERLVLDRHPGRAELRCEIDGPPMSVPSTTKFEEILASARRFVTPLDDVRHIGSLYAERVVLPDVDDTDARPTLVEWVAPHILTIFSGKVSVAVLAGRTAAREIASRWQDPAPQQLDLPIASDAPWTKDVIR